MTSIYRGYIIDHDTARAHAWRGEQSNRMPDVSTHDLASAIQVIDTIIEYDARCGEEEPVVPV